MLIGSSPLKKKEVSLFDIFMIHSSNIEYLRGTADKT